jgi:nucleoside-diphosphate-sugar epimerase
MNLRRPLIVGASGCLGTALQMELTKRYQTKNGRSHLQIGLIDSSSIHKEGDLFSYDVSGFSSIIYAAQSRQYKNYPSGLTDLTYVNITLPLYFARQAALLGIPFVYCSTGSIYEPTLDDLIETSRLASGPNFNPYAASKLFCDQTLISTLPSQEILILRPFYIFGTGSRLPALFPSLISKVASGSEIFLNGADGKLLNPISSIDAARAICHLMENQYWGIYNLAGAEQTSIKRMSNIIGGKVGNKPIFNYQESHSREVSNQSKLLSTNFKYSLGFEKAFNDYLDKVI